MGIVNCKPEILLKVLVKGTAYNTINTINANPFQKNEKLIRNLKQFFKKKIQKCPIFFTDCPSRNTAANYFFALT